MANVVVCPDCGAKNRLHPTGASKSASEETRHTTPRCGRCKAALPWLLDVTDQTFEHEVEVAVPVLVDLWAPWCGPCRMVAPVLEDLARDFAGALKIVKVNVDENPRLAQRFNARSIPMLLVMQRGEVAETVVGARPKQQLEQLVRQYL